MDEQEIEIRKNEAEFWWTLETNSLNYAKEYGTQTIKALITINGAAIIALLSFTASIITKINDLNIDFDKIGYSLISFSCGVVLAVFSAGIGYINFSILNGSLPGPYGLHKYIKDGDVSHFKDKDKSLSRTACLAVIATGLSGLSFVIGVTFSFWILKGIVV